MEQPIPLEHFWDEAGNQWKLFLPFGRGLVSLPHLWKEELINFMASEPTPPNTPPEIRV